MGNYEIPAVSKASSDESAEWKEQDLRPADCRDDKDLCSEECSVVYEQQRCCARLSNSKASGRGTELEE